MSLLLGTGQENWIDPVPDPTRSRNELPVKVFLCSNLTFNITMQNIQKYLYRLIKQVNSK
jgi:hypothetical protein